MCAFKLQIPCFQHDSNKFQKEWGNIKLNYTPSFSKQAPKNLTNTRVNRKTRIFQFRQKLQFLIYYSCLKRLPSTSNRNSVAHNKTSVTQTIIALDILTVFDSIEHTIVFTKLIVIVFMIIFFIWSFLSSKRLYRNYLLSELLTLEFYLDPFFSTSFVSLTMFFLRLLSEPMMSSQLFI